MGRLEHKTHMISRTLSSLMGNILPGSGHLLKRLRGITGIATAAQDQQERRNYVFSRYYHVERVANIATWQTKALQAKGRTLDPEKVLTIVALHSINRLPFAHNSECLVNFNRAKNIRLYLKTNHLAVAEDVVHDVELFLRNDINNMSTEAKTVFAADAACGYIEDPLIMMTALGMNSQRISPDVISCLGLPVNEAPFIERVASARSLFANQRCREFNTSINQIIIKHAIAFLSAHNNGTNLFIEDQAEFERTSTLLRRNFMEARLFPAVNIAVKGDALTTQLIEPLFAKLWLELGSREAAIWTMLRWTDQQTIDFAYNCGLIKTRSDFIPSFGV